jgi:hypothetical protein
MTTIVPVWRSVRKTTPFMSSVCPGSVGSTCFFCCRFSSVVSGAAPS